MYFILQGDYNMKNVMIPNSRFPNNIEEGIYKFIGTLKCNNKPVYIVEVYADVEQNPDK